MALGLNWEQWMGNGGSPPTDIGKHNWHLIKDTLTLNGMAAMIEDGNLDFSSYLTAADIVGFNAIKPLGDEDSRIADVMKLLGGNGPYSDESLQMSEDGSTERFEGWPNENVPRAIVAL